MSVGLGMETEGSVWVAVGSSPSSAFFHSQGLLIPDRMCPQSHVFSQGNSRIKPFYLQPSRPSASTSYLCDDSVLPPCQYRVSNLGLNVNSIFWSVKHWQNNREKKMSLLQKKTGEWRGEITRDLLSTIQVPLRWAFRERSPSVALSSFPFLSFLKIS